MRDHRFWILLFFILRLHGLVNPPLEVAHNWRQTTVTMVARNFFETEANLLYPRIDIAGEKTGITGMEFPLLNYLIYLLSLVFGYAHWYGRLINLLVSSLGLHFFYKLVKKYSSEELAFYSFFLLAVSIWLNYSRKIMPDTFSVSLVIMGFYYGSNYLDRQGGWKQATLFFVLTLAGVLSKLPVIFLLALSPLLLVKPEINRRPKMVMVLLSSLLVGIAGLYYFVWVPHLNERFGFEHFFMGKSLQDGWYDIHTHVPEAAEKFYEEALGISGFLLFVYGCVAAIRRREKTLLLIFGSGVVAFLVIVLKAGFAFYHHAYYIIPFVPFMALLGGYALYRLPCKKAAIVLLCIVSLESIVKKNADFYVKESHLALLNLERDLDALTQREDLILINSGKVPSPMYFAHRKGWIAENQEISRVGFLDSLEQKGLKYIVILKRAFGEDLSLPRTKIFGNADYDIYRN